jgi:hypothetical protein
MSYLEDGGTDFSETFIFMYRTGRDVPEDIIFTSTSDLECNLVHMRKTMTEAALLVGTALVCCVVTMATQ